MVKVDGILRKLLRKIKRFFTEPDIITTTEFNVDAIEHLATKIVEHRNWLDIVKGEAYNDKK